MPVKATFPENWFAEEANPANMNAGAGPSSRPRESPAVTASSSKNTGSEARRDENTIDEEADLDVTEDLTRKNSFEIVMEAAKRAEVEGASMAEPGPPRKPTAAAHRTEQESNTHVQRRALPGPSAAIRPVSAELIELANLPRFTRASGGDAPATPPAAHLPRRSYFASGIAYETPLALFASDRQEPLQVHPALRKKGAFSSVTQATVQQHIERCEPGLLRPVLRKKAPFMRVSNIIIEQRPRWVDPGECYSNGVHKPPTEMRQWTIVPFFSRDHFEHPRQAPAAPRDQRLDAKLKALLELDSKV